MAGKTETRRWNWQLDYPADALWPFVSDTARFNEAAGLPKHEIEEIEQPDGAMLYLASGRQGPFRLAWRELPVNWVAGQWFEHCRIFSKGPLGLLCALAAALAVQRAIAALNARRTAPLAIKLGLHEGPAIAVTLNERLDYFGTTVNMASRQQGQSGGGDIVLSRISAEDPEEAGLLDGLTLDEEHCRLKGFAEETAFLRIPAPD